MPAARPPGLPGMQAPAVPSASETLFAGTPRLIVQTPAQRHDTKKRSGSSDGAQTYDTPVT